MQNSDAPDPCRCILSHVRAGESIAGARCAKHRDDAQGMRRDDVRGMRHDDTQGMRRDDAQVCATTQPQKKITMGKRTD